MKHDFWHERWSKNEIGFHLKQTNPFLQKHWPKLQATQRDSVFIPLCGKSHDILWLANQLDQVIGIEISQKATDDFFAENNLTPTITQGKRFIEYKYENITLLCGDFFNLTPNDVAGCQFTYDRASLIALPLEMRIDYAKKLSELIPNEKSRLLITIEYPQHEMTGPPHSVPPEEVQLHFAEQFDITTLESKDILNESQRFKDKGVTQMVEHTYLLTKE